MASTRKDRTKYCHRCKQADDTLFRVRYTADKQWYFLCKSCVELEKKAIRFTSMEELGKNKLFLNKQLKKQTIWE